MRIILSFVFLHLSILSVNAADKVALVIGNTDYLANYDLENPVNDAKGVAAALEGHGFAVTLGLDLTRENMIDTLQSFRVAADSAEIAMVYYSGHGMEFDGENYLIPVDAKLIDSRDIPETTVPLSAVLRQISGAARLKMIVLDACRNNPFAANMSSPSGKKFVSQGLAAPSWQGDNTLIAYAAAAGSVTPDGAAGGNSPYTASFLDALAGPPRDVGLFMRVVGAGMRERTGSSSLPFVYSSIPPEELIINSGTSSSGQSQTSTATKSAVLPKPFKAPEPAPVEEKLSEFDLAKATQEQLNRLECGSLTVDGVFGRKSRDALTRFYRHSGVPPIGASPTADLLDVLKTSKTAICPPVVTQRTVAKVKPKTPATTTTKAVRKTPATAPQSRPNPVAFSYEVWPARSVRHNVRVSKTTAFGRLTCLGGRGSNIPRKCHWD
jgi:hypothetical protein